MIHITGWLFVVTKRGSWNFAGEKLKLKAYTGEREVDFGRAIGKKPVYLL